MTTMHDSINGAKADVEAQINELRAQLNTLMRDRVRPAFEHAAGAAESAIHDVGDIGRDQAAVLSRKVRAQPITSVLIAAGVGYLLSRLLR